jgi:hypothetical protein
MDGPPALSDWAGRLPLCPSSGAACPHSGHALLLHYFITPSIWTIDIDTDRDGNLCGGS